MQSILVRLPLSCPVISWYVILLKAMKQQDSYNKANYRLQTLNHEIDTQRHDQSTLQSKEMELLVREELLLGKGSHMPA